MGVPDLNLEEKVEKDLHCLVVLYFEGHCMEDTFDLDAQGHFVH